MRSRVRMLATAALVVLLTAALAAPAAAGQGHGGGHDDEPSVVAEGFVGPLHLAFGRGGRLLVADAFTQELVSLDLRDDEREVLATGISAGVDSRDGRVFVTAATEPSETDPGSAGLYRVRRDGSLDEVADLLAFELADNPDGQPFTDDDQASNPYSVLALPGRVLVADAAGNDIVEVRGNREPTLFATLPVSTEGECATRPNNGVPNGGCDPVPTDIELGPDGYLYVSGLGAEVEGFIWKLDRRTGEIVDTISDLPPLTGLAVDRRGAIYASSLFAETIFRISRRGQITTAPVASATDVELHDGRLYAATAVIDPTNPEAPPVGQVLRVPLDAFE